MELAVELVGEWERDDWCLSRRFVWRDGDCAPLLLLLLPLLLLVLLVKGIMSGGEWDMGEGHESEEDDPVAGGSGERDGVELAPVDDPPLAIGPELSRLFSMLMTPMPVSRFGPPTKDMTSYLL